MISAFSTALVDETLLLLGGGMLGVFLVIGIIMGVVYFLNYVTNKKKDKAKE
jgi:preprotein translocase subunit YajC